MNLYCIKYLKITKKKHEIKYDIDQIVFILTVLTVVLKDLQLLISKIELNKQKLNDLLNELREGEEIH